MLKREFELIRRNPPTPADAECLTQLGRGVNNESALHTDEWIAESINQAIIYAENTHRVVAACQVEGCAVRCEFITADEAHTIQVRQLGAAACLENRTLDSETA